jgi:hypothetical protein
LPADEYRNYGEKILRTPDVGAINTELLFKGFQRDSEEHVLHG